MPSDTQNRALHKTYRTEPIIVAAGQTVVVDARGASLLTAFFTGTCTATPVLDADGTALAGASPISLTTQTSIPVEANFYKIAPVSAAAVVNLIC